MQERKADVALSGLFSRGTLPHRVRCVAAYGPVSSVRPGQTWTWRERSPGVGTYEPDAGGSAWCILAHEVRRHWGLIWAAA